VQERSVDTFTFAEGRRPAAFAGASTTAGGAAASGASAAPAHLFKAFAHDKKMQVVIDGQLRPAQFIRVNGKDVDTVEIVIGY
jgi:hypothetical protein